MSALKDILAKKTDSQLRYYIDHVDKHTDEAVRVALAELQLRNAELPDDIVDVVELKLREKAAIKIEEKKSWDTYMVQDEVSPHFYSQRAIYVFSILFSVFFGSFLLAANLKTIGKSRFTVMLYGFAYSVITILVGEYIQVNFFYAFIANSIGVMIMQALFWDRLIGKEIKYNAKPIWKPLIIGVLISAIVIILMIYGADKA
ncbi:hypothetical protein [Pedobacter sp. UC225_65]|uniref:hypothetical protein n=1 Tax=Pedobacter sp. UC225_65 TaxID=3350173 RepID=UPI003672BDF6